MAITGGYRFAHHAAEADISVSVASNIAGRATRPSLDEYIATTQHALTTFSGVHETKAILNISPAMPPANFRTTVHGKPPGSPPRWCARP